MFRLDAPSQHYSLLLLLAAFYDSTRKDDYSLRGENARVRSTVVGTTDVDAGSGGRRNRDDPADDETRQGRMPSRTPPTTPRRAPWRRIWRTTIPEREKERGASAQSPSKPVVRRKLTVSNQAEEQKSQVNRNLLALRGKKLRSFSNS